MNLSELSGHELDVWVAKALERDEPVTGQDKYGAPILAGKRSLSFLIQKYRDFPQVWSPSTKWEDAGRIIESMYGPDFLATTMRQFVRIKLGDK